MYLLIAELCISRTLNTIFVKVMAASKLTGQTLKRHIKSSVGLITVQHLNNLICAVTLLKLSFCHHRLSHDASEQIPFNHFSCAC